jgi:hypothetical protein
MPLKVLTRVPISKVRHKGPLPMSLSIHTTPPAAAVANLAPAPAVKSTSDTTSAAPSQKQSPSQAAVTPSAPQDTVQISTDCSGGSSGIKGTSGPKEALSATIFYRQAAFAIGEQKSLRVDRLQRFQECHQR